MPMQNLVLADRNHLEESEDEAPEAHPMVTNQAFLSKLMQSSRLSDITLYLQLVGQFSQPLALVVSGMIESDNHADTWCFGPNFVMDSYTGYTCNVSGYNKKVNNTEVRIGFHYMN